MNRTEVAVTPERYASGMTFDEYVAHVGSAENLAREGNEGAKRIDRAAQFRSLYEAAHLNSEQDAALRWIAAQPDGPARILAISEDWSSDCRRDIPMLARISEAAGLELRIFDRDGAKYSRLPLPSPEESPNADLMAQFLNHKRGETWQSVPVAAFFTQDMRYLYHYQEYPAIYEKDRIVYGHIRVPKPGETPEQTAARIDKEFGELQTSPFFRIWACAGVDEMLSALHRRVVLGAV
jgi:hypothetical protein